MKKISELLSKLCLFARRLEEQINKGHFKLAEERRLVAETDRLKRSRRTLKEWQVKISGDTLLWDNRRILGKTIIVLAWQAQPTHD